MEEMEDKIGAILNNPQLMQQIMTMAQALNQPKQDEPHNPPTSAPQKQPPSKGTALPQLEGIDFASIQKIAGLTQRAQIDSNQRSLLRALSPYLTRDRIGKLEKAMRAAKVAAVASTALGQMGSNSYSGR